jgi:hypothetical protein
LKAYKLVQFFHASFLKTVYYLVLRSLQAETKIKPVKIYTLLVTQGKPSIILIEHNIPNAREQLKHVEHLPD